LYQQIYDQIAASIVRGDIAGGDALPPIRTVASELRISVISVKRAWEELERDGFIVTAVGRGTFAAMLTESQRREKQRILMEKKLAPGLAFCRILGADAAEVRQIIGEYLGEEATV
jgi:GntR family transcriptional regulator